MKDVKGKWIVAETMQFNDEKCEMEWVTAEKLLAQEDLDKDMALMLNTEVVFQEDGTIDFFSPIPDDVSQEEINEAVEAGEIVLRDGMMLVDQKQWKVEDGKTYADTGAEGEVLGEEVGPWEELKEIDGGLIEMTMYRLKKAD